MKTKIAAALLLLLLVLGLGCISQSPTVETKPVAKEPVGTVEKPKPEPMWEPPAKPVPEPKKETAQEHNWPEPVKPRTPADELKQLIGMWPQEFHVQYNATYFMGEDITEMIQAEYFKVDRKRIDLFVDNGQQFTNTRTFYLPDQTVTCTSVDGEKEFCIKTGKTEAGTDFEKVEKADFTAYEVTKDAPRRIAGDQTNCYKLVNKADAGEIAACYTLDGIPLYLSTLGKQDGQDIASTIEAEVLERRVPDNQLEAPSAQSLEELGGGK